MKAKTGSVSFDKARQLWRAQITTPNGRIMKRFSSKQEASDWITQQQNSILQGTFVEPKAITLGTWLVTWLRDYKKPTLSQRTFERYTELARLCKSIASYRLQALNAPLIQNLYSSLMQERGLSASTVSKVHRLLHAAFRKAWQIDLVPRNIIDAVDPPRYQQNHEIKTFSKEEISKILDVAKTFAYGHYYAMLLLAVTTGMRMGEILGLRWCDVDVRKREISIRQNLQLSAIKGIIFNPPKTKAGRRTITVPTETINALLELKHKRKVEAIEGLVFTTVKGNHPYSPRNIEHTWKRIMEHADIPYRNFHVFRHTHATDLLAAGIPIVEVAHRLGHSRISHTLELYGHAIPRYDQQIADQVSKLYLVKFIFYQFLTLIFQF